MMEIQAIKIERVGAENDENAEVRVLILDSLGYWREVGRERLASNFCTAWSLPNGKEIEE